MRKMKITLAKALTLDGRAHKAGTDIDLPAQQARELIHRGLARPAAVPDKTTKEADRG